MILTYSFYSMDEDDDVEFEFDISMKDLKKYYDSLTKKEKVDAIEAAFRSMPKDVQHEILEEMKEPNFACPDFSRWAEEEEEYCFDLFVDAEDLFEDELHDFFEENAFEDWSYEEKHKDPKDPYEQRGIKRSDFY